VLDGVLETVLLATLEIIAVISRVFVGANDLFALTRERSLYTKPQPHATLLVRDFNGQNTVQHVYLNSRA
jgi:hypothetical protein